MKKNNMDALSKNGYDVDFVNKQIKITREFKEKSGDMTSEAFKIMMALREQLPDFEVVETKAARHSDGKKNGRVQGLSLEFMRVYIEDLYGENSPQIAEFENALKLSKSRKSARYAYMKQWFNATYPEAIKLLGGMPDDERRAIRADKRHNEAKATLAASKKMQEALAGPAEETDAPAADLEESAA
ncbi:MAG: hypothetical protein IKF90_12460 [Parasporobacterium sp.]|nr:hypothetical protein [Parasporobacterium sp.]